MTETSTLTLTDFLLARIAEDESTARSASYFAGNHPSPYRFREDIKVLTVDSRRVLAECQAKGQVIELAGEAQALDNESWMDRGLRTDPGYNDPRCGERILRALALVYADHSDYRDEWRP